MEHSAYPTPAEQVQFEIRSIKGIEVGLGKADPLAVVAAKLEEQHPGHLVMVQAGKFLHAFDKTAYCLSVLKKYQLKLVGTTDDPHLRVGFPAANFKRRMWSMGEEFGIPYVVALGTQANGYDVYQSEKVTHGADVLAAVTPEIVAQVIEDLRQRGNLNQAAAKKMLSSPDTADFRLKSQAQALDSQLLQDIAKMPRDLRSTYGENLRACMARVMQAVFQYGLAGDKPGVLAQLSGDVDLLKHYLAQAPRLSKLKFAFEHRAGLAVELGRLVGGLIRSAKAAP